jgi:hypothetical protein
MWSTIVCLRPCSSWLFCVEVYFPVSRYIFLCWGLLSCVEVRTFLRQDLLAWIEVGFPVLRSTFLCYGLLSFVEVYFPVLRPTFLSWGLLSCGGVYFPVSRLSFLCQGLLSCLDFYFPVSRWAVYLQIYFSKFRSTFLHRGAEEVYFLWSRSIFSSARDLRPVS